MKYTSTSYSNCSCLFFRKIKIGDKNCSLQPLIGCPFGSSFQVDVGAEGSFLSPIIPNAEGMPVFQYALIDIFNFRSGKRAVVSTLWMQFRSNRKKIKLVHRLTQCKICWNPFLLWCSCYVVVFVCVCIFVLCCFSMHDLCLDDVRTGNHKVILSVVWSKRTGNLRLFKMH